MSCQNQHRNANNKALVKANITSSESPYKGNVTSSESLHIKEIKGDHWQRQPRSTVHNQSKAMENNINIKKENKVHKSKKQKTKNKKQKKRKKKGKIREKKRKRNKTWQEYVNYLLQSNKNHQHQNFEDQILLQIISAHILDRVKLICIKLPIYALLSNSILYLA